MNDLFKIKNKYRHQSYSDSLYFKAKDNGDTITIEEIDYNTIKENFELNYHTYNDNSLKLLDFDRLYKKEKRLLELHKDFVEYGIELYYKNSNNDYEHLYTANIGKNKSVTKQELLSILKSNEEVDTSFELKDIDKAVFKAVACYKKAFNDDNLSVAHLTELSTKLVEHKRDLEYLIKEYGNKSTGNYIERFLNLYDYDKLNIIEKIAEKKFKKVRKFEIKTDLDTYKASWKYDSYSGDYVEFIPAKKNLLLFANESEKIDESKTYTKDELEKIINNNKAILVDTSKFDSKAFTFDVSFIGATIDELNDVIINNIDKNMLVDDYKEFLDYFNLAKIDIKLRLKEIKAENDEKIKSLNEEKKQGDKTLDLLNQNEEMKL